MRVMFHSVQSSYLNKLSRFKYNRCAVHKFFVGCATVEQAEGALGQLYPGQPVLSTNAQARSNIVSSQILIVPKRSRIPAGLAVSDETGDTDVC